MFWKRIVLGGLIALNIFLFVRMLVSDQGLFAYRELKADYIALEEQLAEVQQKNLALSQEIRLLQSDSGYIQRVIRQRLNFVKDNEILYIFPDTTTEGTAGAAQDEGKD
ncbi:septum formation initiator family protein [Desulfovibrio mangrovi]|uniref:FtsB family cell division protein n=1 Tax=Desulfovibrio mangrovi TaxID=2976983 RepID=UPI002246946B|nr:septum formation initiator family protein [Desulfovibrio mangrovi]UZP68271.1 septum formation initiator family protein [Desulfovibrio mangrovi]